jgi:hypothetical protein
VSVSHDNYTNIILTKVVVDFCGLHYDSVYDMDRVTYIVCGVTLSRYLENRTRAITTERYPNFGSCAW